MKSGDSTQCDEYLHLINQSSTLLEQILNSVLDYGSITQTTSKMDQLEEFDLSGSHGGRTNQSSTNASSGQGKEGRRYICRV